MPSYYEDRLFREDLFQIDYDQDIVDFGQRVRSERQRQGMSIDYLATLLNCDKATLSRFEKGERIPKLDNVLRIADALHVSLLELLPDRFRDSFLVDVLPEIHGRLMKLPDTKRHEAKEYIVALLDGLLLRGNNANSHN